MISKRIQPQIVVRAWEKHFLNKKSHTNTVMYIIIRSKHNFYIVFNNMLRMWITKFSKTGEINNNLQEGKHVYMLVLDFFSIT